MRTHTLGFGASGSAVHRNSSPLSWLGEEGQAGTTAARKRMGEIVSRTRSEILIRGGIVVPADNRGQVFLGTFSVACSQTGRKPERAAGSNSWTAPFITGNQTSAFCPDLKIHTYHRKS